MMVPDEEVIQALLKDAKKFKSKWELNTSKPTRIRPNLRFLRRTLCTIVKRNQDLLLKEPIRRPARFNMTFDPGEGSDDHSSKCSRDSGQTEVDVIDLTEEDDAQKSRGKKCDRACFANVSRIIKQFDTQTDVHFTETSSSINTNKCNCKWQNARDKNIE